MLWSANQKSSWTGQKEENALEWTGGMNHKGVCGRDCKREIIYM